MKKVFTKKEISKIAGEILNELIIHNHNSKTDHATIIALSGDLGAGKTTLTQEIARLFSVKEKVISPTFVIMKIYELKRKKWKHLIHIDAYRLEKESELLKLGWEEIIADKSNIILIEWPEKVNKIIPKSAVLIQLKHVNDKTREISINAILKK